MAQFIYRRPPYPAYDIEGIESWLEDLAADGLMLDPDGYIFGTMQFQPAAPRHLKYRLEAIPNRKVFEFFAPKAADEKAQTLYRDFGWEYLGIYQDFYIYRSLDENPVELNTDPTIQAQTLQSLCRNSLAQLLLFTALVVGGILWALMREPLIMRFIFYGWKRTLWFLVFMVAWPVYFLLAHLHLRRIQKQLASGKELKRNKNWRKGRFIRRFLLALPMILYLGLGIANITANNPIWDCQLHPDDYPVPFPFVTITDMAPERDYEPDIEPQLSNWYTPLTPSNYYWHEYAYLHHPEQEQWYGGLTVYYHKAVNEAVAKHLITTYTKQQDAVSHPDWAPGETYTSEELDATVYGFDQITVYHSMGADVVYLRNGTTVIKAIINIHDWEDSTQHYLTELWLQKAAELLQ